MKAVSLMLTAALAAAPPAAIAQERQGTDKDAQLYLAEFSDCVVKEKNYRPKVDAFLRTVPDSSGFAGAALKAADLHCLDTAARRSQSRITMRMQPAVFRSGLYPALYKRDFGRSGPVAGIAAVPPLPLSAEFDGPIADLPADYRPIRAVGDCVARADPASAHALLTATPFDAREDAAIGQLKGALAGCLPAGQTLRLNRAALRSTVGEAMVKLSRAASAEAGAGTGAGATS